MKRMLLFFLSVVFFMAGSLVCATEVELGSVHAAEIDDAGNVRGVSSSDLVPEAFYEIKRNGLLYVCAPTRCGSHLSKLEDSAYRSARLEYNYEKTMARFCTFLRELSSKLIPFVLECDECGSDEASLDAILDCVKNGAVKKLRLRNFREKFVIDVEKLPYFRHVT